MTALDLLFCSDNERVVLVPELLPEITLKARQN